MKMSASELLTTVPVATVVIMVVAFAMSIVTSLTNRAIISRFVGLDKYRAIQREVAAFRKESMEAARSNDKKQLEKIKKKQAQINAMQAQTMKVSPIQLAVGFCFLPIFMFVMRPLFLDVAVIAIPGITLSVGTFLSPFIVWYFILSAFFSSLMMRVMGTMPIE
jgi:uncharacterized membrane protein (DUF106 family)